MIWYSCDAVSAFNEIASFFLNIKKRNDTDLPEVTTLSSFPSICVFLRAEPCFIVNIDIMEEGESIWAPSPSPRHLNSLASVLILHNSEPRMCRVWSCVQTLLKPVGFSWLGGQLINKGIDLRPVAKYSGISRGNSEEGQHARNLFENVYLN